MSGGRGTVPKGGVVVKWLSVLALHACALAGCYESLPGEVYELPDQAEATRSIWVDSYGMGETPPPTVRWVTGDELDPACPMFLDDWIGFRTSRGCLDGDTNPDEGIAVAWQPGRALSWTSLAHELYHWRQLKRGEDWHAHPSEVYGRGGVMDQANEAVRAGEQQ